MRDLARSMVAVGTAPAEVLDILIGQAWAAVLMTCRSSQKLLSDMLVEMATQLNANRLRPCVAQMALESAGINPLLLAIHADQICGEGAANLGVAFGAYFGCSGRDGSAHSHGLVDSHRILPPSVPAYLGRFGRFI